MTILASPLIIPSHRWVQEPHAFDSAPLHALADFAPHVEKCTLPTHWLLARHLLIWLKRTPESSYRAVYTLSYRLEIESIPLAFLRFWAGIFGAVSLTDLTVPTPRPIRAMVVFGTRPEAIKLLEVIRLLRHDPRFKAVIVTTGQHRQMVDQILTPFGVRLDHDLGIMEPGQTLNGIVGRAVPALDRLYEAKRPDIVIVQGDTTSAFCAGLAAFNRKIPVAHVEAGLRSFDRSHPYPEEINRRMLSALVDLHFPPTEQSAANLTREGLPREDIVVTGNTVVDTLLLTLRSDLGPGAEVAALPGGPNGAAPVLITLHRRETWAALPAARGSVKSGSEASIAPLGPILKCIRTVAEAHPDVPFIYPVHLNPMVQEPAHRLLGGVPNVHLTMPLAYIPFVHLMARSRLILSDSGGVQEEAPSLGVPVLIVRETTERPEAVDAGLNRLVGIEPERIRRELTKALSRTNSLVPKPHLNPYGDGLAHKRIGQSILHFFSRAKRPTEFQAPIQPVHSDYKTPRQGAVHG